MSESTAHERSLTTIFQYNGHSWDAFEVLGLPAGSSDQKAEEAFQKSIKTAHSQSREFFEAAIAAIRNKDRN